MDLSKKKFFIFDLDGTLFDTLPDLAVAVNFTLETFGLSKLSEKTIRSYIGNGSRNLVRRSLGEAPVSLEEAHAVFFDYYKEHCTLHTRFFPGVHELLKKDFRCAILTNKPILPTRLILSHFGILGRFERVLGGDNSPERKPSAEGIFEILARTKIEKEEAVMIGDDVPDLLSARNACIDSILILSGFGKRENILPHLPEVTVEHLIDLLDYWH